MLKKTGYLQAAFVSLAVLSGSAPAIAHPHAWIDLQSQVLLDENGFVRALQLDWVFDDYYTVAIADTGQSLDLLSDDIWMQIAERNISNLTDYDYFTAVKFDDQPVDLGLVTNYEGGLRDGRMWMRFEVPLAEPIDPKAGQLSFSVYDPTYYIEVAHLEDDVIAFNGQGADNCQGEILQPNPTFEQISLAASLDMNETSSDGLGELFAETVIIHCS